MEAEIVVMGFLVGALVGLTGVGGAALLTPVLMWIGISPSVAVATDLFYNSVTKLFGSIQHIRQKTIDLALVKYLAIGSVPSALIAVLVLQAYPPLAGHQDSIIKHALGVVLVIVALATIAKQFYEKLGSNRWQEKPLHEKRSLTIVIGCVLGFIVGLTSIGSGSLFALAMIYLYRLKSSTLVGTDILHAFLLVSAAGAMHAVYGNIDYMLALNLLLGSVPGVMIGSRLSARVPSRPLRTVMAAIILFSGLRLI
ncbi:sulfite exporter TauE/SafE family protein [Paenibacillus alkalitolerans]|uniref:sulfite exporter TauE/SafE family protein n=1 Tax=Paenibacillus alkalitolerans TaxID=2799335 RepID=UPI0018F5C841|nr:sulfite exporter TauE/SafE family protein [Paenibacillus alkalitolerans]